MYPLNFFNLFPAFPKNNKVFVAMSFSEEFEERWEILISKTISSIEIEGVKLEPYRVDIDTKGDSIQTEIIKEISDCKLFFADITTIGYLNDKPIRNGNVMYEVGIAHSVRLPEEVILFRSDEDIILFDITNIRVNYYNPKEIEESLTRLEIALTNALKEIDIQKHLAVERASSQLDFYSWFLLMYCLNYKSFTHPAHRTAGEFLSGSRQNASIIRLLEMGLLQTRFKKTVPENEELMNNKKAEEMVEYVLTPFGYAVAQKTVNKFRYTEAEIIKLGELFKSLGI